MTTITSATNAAVKAARKLGRRQARERAGRFLVEGAALREAHANLRELFVADDAVERHRELLRHARGHGAAVRQVSQAVLESLTGTVTPQGAVGVAELPVLDLDDVLSDADLVVVLCGVADPGNLGAALRSADAAGVDAVVVTAGSVDVRNPKAVRASAGSVFHLPLVHVTSFDEVRIGCRRSGQRLIAADRAGEQVYTDLDWRPPSAVVFGSEAHGLPAEILEGCDTVARIPMFAGARQGFTGAAESLNLAATVTLFAFEASAPRRRTTEGRLAGCAQTA